LTWTDPVALWLLLAIPLIWAVQLVARTRFNRRQRVLQTVTRCLLLALLALATARPVISMRSSRESVVYLVDVSHSVASTSVAAAADRIDEIEALIRPAHSRILAFARRTTTVDGTAALRGLAEIERTREGGETLDRGGTDLEGALLAARGELAAEHVPRLVLFSDGHATDGDTAAAVARLALEGITVSVEPLAGRIIADAWINSVTLPDRVAAGAAFAAEFRVGTHRPGTAVLTLQAGGTTLGSREVTLTQGMTSVTVDAALIVPGPHVIEGTLSMAGDPLTANNSFARDVWVEPKPSVLYIEGAPASAKYLSGALSAAGFDVAVRPPAGIPATAADLDPWDVVVLSDVGRAAFSDAAMTALSEWVEARGGGLLVAGGEAIFGEKGYRHTPLERLTPVTFERRDEPEVALVIVLDRSWSMAGTSMELTKTAAQAAVDVLSDEQSVGILTFNDKFDWDVTLRNVGRHRDMIRKSIAAIGPGGHTLIYPAIEQAYLALKDAKARARHVILLSDGRSYPAEYEALVRKMALSRITMSTVAVGPSADPDLLRDLAEWGKGRAYVVADAAQVPEIFVKEAKSAATPAFDERAITPVLRTPGFLTGVDLARMPLLKGRTATVLKEGALELLATDEDDPLLAFWPVGLGRTAVFTSDLKDRWGADWVTWRGYGPFFSSVVRALQRQRPPAVVLEVTPGPVRGGTRTLAIAVELREPDGQYRNLANPTVRARRQGGEPVELATRQTAPGRYEATLLADAAQALTLTVPGAEGASGVTTRTILPDPAREYRFSPPDEALLRSIAASTGGEWRPTGTSLGGAPRQTRAERRPLWPALLVRALLVWCLDILLRRVRIFEPRPAV